jgi:hypothetical protein
VLKRVQHDGGRDGEPTERYFTARHCEEPPAESKTHGGPTGDPGRRSMDRFASLAMTNEKIDKNKRKVRTTK